ncbi:MAG: ubiquinol-cytochrome c reductase iron-sulfur subunit [Gammaproteobacteria bacterium RBG_16_57_12]|nr:MAG: ubiquinol-cytochrome c reductase iron-sulfur subunit [Gammaproteobacteria bacterium RBG_16_57_12]
MSGEVDKSKRRLLGVAAGAMGGVGAAGVAIPFIASMSPSARAQAAGAPVEVDISKMEPGQRLTVEWRGKPVWILRRTPEMLAALPTLAGELRDPNSEEEQQPDYAKNPLRSVIPEYLVLVGICTHLGCSPGFRPEFAPADLGPGWKGGFFCPCHGSRFDLAGRVYKGVPAPLNLEVPPHRYLGKLPDTKDRIIIGTDPENA